MLGFRELGFVQREEKRLIWWMLVADGGPDEDGGDGAMGPTRKVGHELRVGGGKRTAGHRVSVEVIRKPKVW